MKSYDHTKINCSEMITSKRTFQDYLFIKTDASADEQTFSLSDFPSKLCVDSER